MWQQYRQSSTTKTAAAEQINELLMLKVRQSNRVWMRKRENKKIITSSTHSTSTPAIPQQYIKNRWDFSSFFHFIRYSYTYIRVPRENLKICGLLVLFNTVLLLFHLMFITVKNNTGLVLLLLHSQTPKEPSMCACAKNKEEK